MNAVLRKAALVASLATAAPLAWTQPVPVEAFDNATIQPAGPRSGNNGLAFFNIEGSDFGNFASYGVARFDLAAARSALDLRYGSGGWMLQAIDLQLTQSNAAFTTNGEVRVGYTRDPGTLLASSGLRYPVDGDFPFVEPLLGFVFTAVATGHTDTYRLWEQGTHSRPLLVQHIDAGDDRVALVLTEGEPGVAATYAGYTNFTWAGPTLLLHAAAVPEPAAFLQLAGGLLLVAAARRRRATP